MEIYKIRIGGHLEDRWADSFGGLQEERDEAGCTTLYGPVTDQKALKNCDRMHDIDQKKTF